jgi:hypothetical protein
MLANLESTPFADRSTETPAAPAPRFGPVEARLAALDWWSIESTPLVSVESLSDRYPSQPRGKVRYRYARIGKIR